jgi:hypothetical protein
MFLGGTVLVFEIGSVGAVMLAAPIIEKLQQHTWLTTLLK